MMKLLIMTLPVLILSACQTAPKPPQFREKQCFVNFLSPSAETTFNKGLGLKRSQRVEKDLLVSSHSMNAWFIRRDDGTNYVVYKMDWELDENHPETIAANRFIASIRKTLVLDDKDEMELFQIYKKSGKIVPHQKFEQDVKSLGMKAVKCEELENSRRF